MWPCLRVCATEAAGGRVYSQVRAFSRGLSGLQCNAGDGSLIRFKARLRPVIVVSTNLDSSDSSEQSLEFRESLSNAASCVRWNS